jgi:hypothetical protein
MMVLASRRRIDKQFDRHRYEAGTRIESIISGLAAQPPILTFDRRGRLKLPERSEYLLALRMRPITVIPENAIGFCVRHACAMPQ